MKTPPDACTVVPGQAVTYHLPECPTTLGEVWVGEVQLTPAALEAIKPRPPSRFPRPVVCAWCGNKYRCVMPPDNTQGDACSASVWLDRDGTWYLNGHYGSSDYDCMLFRFRVNPPEAPADPVCDNCIGERLVAGDLEHIEGHFP